MSSISGKSSSRSTSGNSASFGDGESWPVDGWEGPVLVLRQSSLGDVVLASSAARLIQLRRPELDVVFVTRQAYVPALRWLDGVEVRAEESLAAADEEELRRRLRSVLDLQGGARGLRASRRLAPRAKRFTYDRASLQRRLFVASGGRLPKIAPVIERFQRAVAGKGVQGLPLRPFLSVPAEERERMRARIEALDPGKRWWILSMPSASKPLKAIPEWLCQLIEEYLRQKGLGVVRLLPAGEPERERMEGMLGNFALSVPLEELPALIAAADAACSADSGLMHLATAVGTPVVALFGPTHPGLGFAPYGAAEVVGADVPCRPCHIHGPRRCWLGHHRCWTDLPWREAAEALLRMAETE